ncbi:MAG: MCP four helix bundle domain-containing protein [Planctomycetaceae bacterium]|nr:MCP four helix bundle domain-containing protein [Planctomycetaceae bacterium]
MSMAKKIYLIIGFMVVMAAAIGILGLYSANQMAAQMSTLGQQANRTISLNVIDRITQERRTVTNAIIESVDENRMREMMDTDMENLEAEMTREITWYYENFPKPVTPEREANVAEIRTMWADYVTLTDRMAELSYENSNERAARINRNNRDAWEAIDHDVEMLARALNAPSMRQYNISANKSRNDLLRFRMLMNEYIPEADPDRMAELEKPPPTCSRAWFRCCVRSSAASRARRPAKWRQPSTASLPTPASNPLKRSANWCAKVPTSRRMRS